jgi:predicted metal-dependent peptidase
MEDNPSACPSGRGVWQGAAGGTAGPRGDVLDAGLERELFPDEAGDGQAQAEAVREASAQALSLGAALDAMKGKGRGAAPGAATQMVSALRGLYRTPWEAALQRWLESVAPSDRTFVRPSRRGADRSDLVLPGRKREGWILNVVLDTSGSMTDEVPRALGAIADFCDAVAVEQIRLVECDTAVTSDKVLSPSEAARHEVTGYGGSDLTPALRLLADDPEVRAAVVLTDGDIDYPKDEMPYDVLWVLPAWARAEFRPPYGAVIRMQQP